MVGTFSTAGVAEIAREIDWLIEVLNARFQSYFDEGQPSMYPKDYPPPSLGGSTYYSRLVKKNRLKAEERLVLTLALVPHLQPRVLDVFFTKNAQYERGFTEFGGIKGEYFGGFLPTGETALFMLAGGDLQLRQSYFGLFDEGHPFARQRILWLDNPHSGEPFMSGVLTLSEEVVDQISTGKLRKPRFSVNFPASLITTGLEWSDLVLPRSTLEHIREILAWVKHHKTLQDGWGFAKRIKPGYRSLFYGPPGTGKTLTATLLGKHTHRDVYRIDLSMVVSKYIGETEKNLSRVFEKAENKNWILFFDEADALFGKRTEIRDAHDRYANQEVSYLLQKIEEHAGLVILASNMKSNIDAAFARRFQSVIYFPMPKASERLRLWQNTFSPRSELEDRIDLKRIAEKYEISGGSIVNIVRYASLMALDNNTRLISEEWLWSGIKKEFQKEGKTI
jgi:hypothetical protein